MAQTTLDRVTGRVRELADRTGEVTNQALSNVLPDRRASRRAVNGWRRYTRRIGLRVGMRASKTAPATVKSAWQAGEFAGRLEGIAGTVPNMTRLWLDRSMAQIRARTATGGAKAVVRTAPTGIANMRMIANLRGRAQGTAATTRASAKAGGRMASLAQRAAGAAAITGGIAALNKRFARASKQVGDQVSKTAQQTAKSVKRTPSARRGWTLTRRTTTGPLQVTQQRLRRGWRWSQFFVLGFAVGAVWAYLFAPRRQPSQDKATTPSTTTEQQRSTAQV